MNKQYIACIIAAAIAVAIVGCGGGGGGGGSTNTGSSNTNQFANLPTNSFQFASTNGVTQPYGLVTGGSVVTINGTGALTAPVTVYFGSAQATNIQVISNSSAATQITAVTPPANQTGTVDVRVVDAHGVSAISTYDTFSYIPTPPAPPNTTGSTAGSTTGSTTGITTGGGVPPGSTTGVTTSTTTGTTTTGTTTTGTTTTGTTTTGTTTTGNPPPPPVE